MGEVNANGEASGNRNENNCRWGSKTFPPHSQSRYIELVAMGFSKKACAHECGVSPNVVYQFRRQNPDFNGLVEQAEYGACDLVEDALMEKILLDKDRAAMIFWLVNRSNGRWKDIRQITMTTPEDNREQKAVVHDILSRLKKEEKDGE